MLDSVDSGALGGGVSGWERREEGRGDARSFPELVVDGVVFLGVVDDFL
jgi:hypothetical protein